LANRLIRVTTAPTEQSASANITAGRRKNLPDAIVCPYYRRDGR
jgi:hypothetical protein